MSAQPLLTLEFLGVVTFNRFHQSTDLRGFRRQALALMHGQGTTHRPNCLEDPDADSVQPSDVGQTSDAAIPGGSQRQAQGSVGLIKIGERLHGSVLTDFLSARNFPLRRQAICNTAHFHTVEIETIKRGQA